MSAWRTLVRWLTHDPALERAKAERARVEAWLDSLVDRENAELIAVVRETLFHQGEPRGNLERVLEVLRTGQSYGWDEADYEVEGDRVRVSFLGATVETERAVLRSLLERIRTGL